MKKLLLLSFLLLSFNIFAQSNEEEKAVQAVIEKMFDAMRSGDSTSLRNVFHPSARLMSTYYKDGASKIHEGSIDRFVASVGTPHDEIFDEKIWSYDIRIDGNLASVWTEYSFYLGKNLRHCGVNAFHLFKSDEGWVITQITDTRRKENCKTE
jgi:hypothetical protein